MANELELFEFLEMDNAEEILARKRRRLDLRVENDPFKLDEEEFIKRYSLTKELTHCICDDLRPFMKSPLKTTDLTVETKVLTALSFYATGSYQRPTGDIEGHFMAQQTVSSAIKEVTACLNSEQIQQKYIYFPASEQERHRIKTEFYHKFNIPGVLGCIDCLQVAIVRPKLNKDQYYCHKHYHSLNVQLVCDADMNILSVDANNGGATHDSYIWSNHPLRAHLEDLSNTENVWLLGDSGYPLRKTMMTPMLDVAPGTAEAHYTTLQVHARNIIEHTIGLLKARFRCLLVHKVLHYTPETAGSIVNACVILHNLCNRANSPMKQLSDEDKMREAQLQFVHAPAAPEDPFTNRALQEGWDMRSNLIRQLWDSRH